MRKRGRSGAGGDEDGVEAFVVHQFVDGDGLADHDVGLEDHAAAAQHVDFVVDNLFRQAEFRDAVHQHAAEFVQRLEDVHLVSHLDEVAGAGQAGRAAADEADFLARRGRRYRRAELSCLALPIGDEALQIGDSDRLALLAEHAA